MNSAPRTPPILASARSKRLSSRRTITFLGTCAAIVLLLSLGFYILFQSTRRDTLEDYHLLCACLMGNLPVDGVPEVQPTEAEIQARIPVAEQALARISRRGKRLAPIARDFSDLVRQAVMLQRNAPQLSAMVFGSAQAALGLYTGQQASVNEGGQKALRATENLWNAFVSFQKLLGQRQVLAVQLADLAAQFSGPETNSPMFAIAFAEHKPGLFEFQKRARLLITNSSSRALNNCLVAVRFSDSAGKSCLNLYFVSDWQAAEKRRMEFSDSDFPKTIVEGVQRVDVRLWSKECSLPAVTLTKPKSGWQSY